MKNNLYRIAIRVDGGPSIGLGHFMRCLSLARELEKRFCYITFISRKIPESIKRVHLNFINLPKKKQINDFRLIDELEDLKKRISEISFDCLIIDHYEASYEYLKRLNNEKFLTVFIDDFCDDDIPTDIIINGNIYAKEACYTNNNSKKLLLGPQYLLLRKEFNNLPTRSINKEVKKILITAGGSDNQNLTIRFLNILKNNAKTTNLEYDVVAGSDFLNIRDIEKYSKKYNNINLFKNVRKMSKLMLDTDIALSTSGTVLYELAATGTPSISLIVAKNQEKVAKALGNIGCTINLGWHDKVSDESLKKEINVLLERKKVRLNLSRKGQKTIKGKGSTYCAEAILSSLRKMKES